MLSPWVKAFQSCGSITDPAIGYITKSMGGEVVILLAGGDKHAQTNDIKTALRLARNLLKLIMTKTITTRYDVADTFAPQKKWLLILKLVLRKQVGMQPSLPGLWAILPVPRACPRWHVMPVCLAKVFRRHSLGNTAQALTQFSKS